jgi:prephenate dehydrogenase
LRVAIIGAGKMGRWFTKFFKSEGFSVVVSNRTRSKAQALGAEFGVEVAKSDLDAIDGANWILLCVSLESLDSVLSEIGSHLQAHQVIMDISSIKEIPVNLLHKYVHGSITLGTHPVFGPGAKNLRGQNFVLTPVNDQEKRFAHDFKDWLEARGAKVSFMSPKKHDMLMSLVLGFPHFVGLVAGDTLINNSDFVDAKAIGGATYKLLLTLTEAVSSEEPGFYSNLHMSLPEMEKIESLFLSKVKEWLNIVKRKDCAEFSYKMQQVRKRLKELDPEYERAYQAMYLLLNDS